MSTHMPGFQSSFSFLNHFVTASSSIWVHLFIPPGPKIGLTADLNSDNNFYAILKGEMFIKIQSAFLSKYAKFILFVSEYGMETLNLTHQLRLIFEKKNIF